MNVRIVFKRHEEIIDKNSHWPKFMTNDEFVTIAGASGRQFEDDAEQLMNSIDHEFSSLSQSGLSVDDILCLPRQYCDKLKAQKHLLDQYPNMKTVAAWMTEKYFENVAESSSEYYSHGQCNIKQCLQELLN